MNDAAEGSRRSTELRGYTEGSVLLTLTGDALGLGWFYKTFTDFRLYCVCFTEFYGRLSGFLAGPARSKRNTIGVIMVLLLFYKLRLTAEPYGGSSCCRLYSEGVAAFYWWFCELLRRRCQEGFTAFYGRCHVLS